MEEEMKKTIHVALITILFFHFSLFTYAIAGKKKVIIATLDYPPYVSKSLPGKGWTWEVAQKAFESQGFSAELHIVPWARAVHMTKSGEVDALFIANQTPERNKWAIFSDQVGVEASVLWKRRDRQYPFEKLGDLKGLKIGGLRSSAQMQFLTDAGIAVYTLNDFSHGIKMLNAGRLDLVLADKLVLTHLLNSMPPKIKESLDYIDPPVHVAGFHLAVSRKTPNSAEIVEAFNKGLKEIHENGIYDDILRKHKLLW